MKIYNKTKKFTACATDYQSEGTMCRDEYLDKTKIAFFCTLPAKVGDRFDEGDIVTVDNPIAKSDWNFKVTDVSDLGNNIFGITLEYEKVLELEKKDEPTKQVEEKHECKQCSCENKKSSGFKSKEGKCDCKKNTAIELPDAHCILLFSDNDKITVAAEYNKGEIVKVETATCHKADKFDFYKGANIAFNRLVNGTDGCACDCEECTCDESDCEDDVIWAHEDDDTPLMSTTGKPLMLGDYVVGHKEGGYVPGVIGHSNGKYYLCNESGPAIEIEKFTDFDLVWRD